jgi:2',3'-cyclic-nucleotide 2'-phosphodiesterase (5'-nucleotidase family)
VVIAFIAKKCLFQKNNKRSMWKSYNFYEFTAMRKHSIVLIVILLLYGCKSLYHISSVNHAIVSVSDTKLQDSVVYRMVLPYRQILDSLMNEVISHSEVDLEKGFPEGTLGNFVCDILLEYASRNTTTHVDFCMLNNGGLRIPSISKGSILIKNIYELLPFENTLEVIEIEGTVCKKLLDEEARRSASVRG